MSPRAPYIFQSALAPLLENFLDFKRKMGYTAPNPVYHARDLDHFLLFYSVPSVGKLDEALTVRWVHSVPGLKAITRNARLSFLREFFRYLVRLGLVPYNPALRVPFMKEPQIFKPYLFSVREIERLLEEAGKIDRPVGRTVQTVIFLLYACGLRVSEAVKLNIQDVDFSENTLSLWQTKFHKERLVPFSAVVAEKLKAYLAFRRKAYPPAPLSAPFFGSPRRPRITDVTLNKYFRLLREQCGLGSFHGVGPRMHDLRHTFAVHRLYKWYQEGINPMNKLPVLSTYMGHVCIENTQVYLTMTLALLREGDRRFQAACEGLTRRPLGRVFKDL